MVSSINIAVSGLNAASTRLNVAAENVANASSTRTVRNGEVENTPPAPLEVVQTSQEVGGVSVEVRETDTPPTLAQQPDSPFADENGFVATPGTDLAEQIVNTKIASYDFKANLKTIDVQDEMFRNLLDIRA